MLGRCYRAELTKLVKGKGIYIALAVILGMIILLTIFSSVLGSESDLPSFGDGGIMDTIRNVPRSEYPNVVATLKSQLDLLEKETNTVWSRFFDQKGQYKSYIAIFEYLIANPEVSIRDLEVPQNLTMGVGDKAYIYMYNAVLLTTEVAIFYAVIMMSSLLAGEYREGTLRMQFMRPNSRATILTSKWLAVLTTSVGLLIMGMIVSMIASAIRFGVSNDTIMCVIANTHIFTVNEHVFVLIDFLFSIIAIYAMIAFSTFMCSISKFNRAGSMAVPIIVLLFGNMSAYLLQVIYLGVIDFTNNINLISFILPGGMNMPYTSLYTALPVLLVYITIFMSVSYIKMKRVEM